MLVHAVPAAESGSRACANSKPGCQAKKQEFQSGTGWKPSLDAAPGGIGLKHRMDSRSPADAHAKNARKLRTTPFANLGAAAGALESC